MDRKYILTPDEFDYIKYLNSAKISTGDIPSFQKNLLEFPKKISIGNQGFGNLFEEYYIEDSDLTIKLIKMGLDITENIIYVEPRPYTKVKPDIEKVIKKILLLCQNSKSFSINLTDVVVDFKYIIELSKEAFIKSINLNNCYIKNYFNDGLNEINKDVNRYKKTSCNFKYCSIPHLNIISNFNMNSFIFERCHFRDTKPEFINVLAEKLSFQDSNFYKDGLFLQTSMQNLTSLEIHGKVLTDIDLLLLEKIAPNLEYATIDATIRDEETLQKINLSKYYNIILDHYSKGNLITSNIKENGKLVFSLSKNKKLRERIIKNLSEAIDSMYKNDDYKFFKPKIEFEECLRKKITELECNIASDLQKYIETYRNVFKIDDILEYAKNPKTFNKKMNYHISQQRYIFKKFISRLRDKSKIGIYTAAFDNGYEEYIFKIREKLLELTQKSVSEFSFFYKKSINKYTAEVKDYKELFEISKGFENISFDSNKILEFEDVQRQYYDMFRPIYSNYSDFSRLAAACAFPLEKNEDKTGYSFYVEHYVESFKKNIIDFSDTKKKNYDLIKVIQIAFENSYNYFQFSSLKNYDFTKNVVASSDIIFKAKKLIEKNYKGDDILKEVGYKLYERKKGLIIKNSHLNFNRERFEAFVEMQNAFDEAHALSIATRRRQPGTEIGRTIMGYESIITDKYKPYDDAKKEVPGLTIVRYNLENGTNLNERDYALYNDIVHNKGMYINKTIIYILKGLHKECEALTRDDYQKIKDRINEHYSSVNPVIMYLEVIRYITGKYPDFINRVLENKKMDPIQNKIFTLEYFSSSYIEIINEHMNKSRTDYEQKKLILRKNESDFN